MKVDSCWKVDVVDVVTTSPSAMRAGGTNVMWCQGGMAAANEKNDISFPELFWYAVARASRW